MKFRANPFAKGILCLAAASVLAVSSLRAQLVADGATNTLSNATNSIPGNVTVGTNGSFTLLVLSNNCLLTNSGFSTIGANASAKSNEVRLVSPTARWFMGASSANSLFVGSNSAANRLVVSNGATAAGQGQAFLGYISESASNNQVWVTGSNSMWSGAASITVGLLGSGNQVVVSNGGTVLSVSAVVGASTITSNNLALVTGAGSLWSNVFTFSVGANGSGNRLLVSEGGVVRSSGIGRIGGELLSGSGNNLALITGSGSVWSNALDLEIGRSLGPNNQLVVSNGASAFVGGNVLLGVSSGANSNSVLVTDPGTSWFVLNNLYIGSNGALSRLVVSNGATVLSSNAVIGASTGLGNNNFALLTGAGTLWSNRNDFTVGNFGAGNRLDTATGAALQIGGNAVVGANIGANGNLLNLFGSGVKCQIASNLYVGSNGGSFNQLLVSDGVLESGNTFVSYGSAASNNTVICNNAARWTNRGSLFVGYGGGGNLLNIGSSGLMSVQNDRWIGFGAGGPSHSNVVSVNFGGRWVGGGNPNIFMGSNGAFNRLLISSGGQVISTGGHIGYATSGSNNTVLVTDTNSLWDASTINVGEFSVGNTLTVSNGAVIDCFAGTVGNLFFADNNTAIVTGTGSYWTNRFSLDVGIAGSNSRLLATNGGTVICIGNVRVGQGAGSTGNRVIVDGGAFFVTNASGTAALDVRRGTNVLNAGRIEADKLWVTNAAGRFELNGGTLVTREANITEGLPFVMGQSATPAVWDVRGSNNFIAGDLQVGGSSPMNQLFITNGATLTNNGFGTIGFEQSASSNAIVISGPASQWDMSANLHVAGGPFNRLEVSNGGKLTGRNGIIGVGGSNNLVVVSGSGSLWSNAIEIAVGDTGRQNQLVISNAATVQSAVGYIGTQAGASNNLALVTDPGSLWSMTGELNVGFLGSRNQLVVSNGASVFANNVVIGLAANSLNNRVTLSGGNLRTTNAAGTGFLDVRRGTNVLNAGLVETDNLLLTNAAGAFDFKGGTLSARNTTVNNGQMFRVGNGASPATFHLAGNGTHSFANGGFVDTQGSLTGNGTVIGALQILGGATLSPGTSIGKIAFGNAPTLGGAVVMEISRNGSLLTNDVVQVAGMLFYGGSLTVSNLGPTALASGDRFKLFDASSYGGSFTAITLPALAADLFWTNKLLVDGSLEVLDAKPAVTTLPASAVGTTTATLNGNVNPRGSNASGWFEHGLTTNYGSVTPPQALGGGSAGTNFAQALTGLSPDSMHHFRAVASNSFGVAFGADQNFIWSPNVIYTWTGTGNIRHWFKNFGAVNSTATLANSIPGELTITETSAAAGASQAFSDSFPFVRETPSEALFGLDLTGWEYLEFDLGHNGAGNINVQFFVQASPNSTFVALGPDVAVTPGVNTYQFPLSGLTATQAVNIRTMGFNVRDHGALGNVVWTMREVRAGGAPLTTRDLITHDTGSAEGGLQGAIVNFDGPGVLGHGVSQDQTGLSHNPAGSGSLQWTDLGGGPGGAISWGNGTAWNGDTANNRTTDLSNFDTMTVRISAAGTGGSINVQGFFQVNNFQVINSSGIQSVGTQSLPIDGQFHDLTFSLAALTNMNVVDTTGINLAAHATDLVMNVDLIRFDIAPLRITSIERVGPDIRLKFRSSLGQRYYLEYSPDLSPGSWTTIGNLIFGDGQELTVTDFGVAAAAGSRYYRISQLP